MADDRTVVKRIQPAAAEILALYDEGLPKGASTGWSPLDRLYSVVPGLLTVVTGWPGCGKSEWVDALTMNLAEKHGWRFMMCSFENQPVKLHQSKLLEKRLRAPFGIGPGRRIERSEIEPALSWLNRHFAFFDYEQVCSVEALMAAATHWLADGVPGPVGLVIDPWNELEHSRPSQQSETEYISNTLRRLRKFARFTEYHIWVVAHPQKLQRGDNGKLPIPTPDTISGSQHWWNKADNAICVHRDLATDSSDVEIHVQKVRFKHTGMRGMALLQWDRVTGRYAPLPQGSRRT
jgi:twinkle protein